MKRQYGDKKGKSVFYATANKQGMTGDKKKKRPIMPDNMPVRGK